MADEGGVWRTISGRRVFIRDGQSLSEAMRDKGEIKLVLEDVTGGARNAISIQDFSRYPDEQEVLYSGNSSFRVVGFREEESPMDGSTIYIAEVEEVRR